MILKKRNSKFIVCVIAVILLQIVMPMYRIKIPFTKSELEWFSIYQPMDTLIFRNGNEADTISIFSAEINNPRNIIPHDWEGIIPFLRDNNIFKGSAGFDAMLLQRNGKTYKHAGHFVFKKPNYFISPNMRISFLDAAFSTEKLHANSKIDFNGRKCNAFVIEDSMLTSNKYFDGKGEIPPVVSMIWCRPYGLVEYTYNNGDTYRLAKIKRHNGQEIDFEQ